MFRIVLIPLFAYIYFLNFDNNYTYAFGIILFSALSDVVDGFIARKFNMISDVGKVLDPIADKLTQVAVVLCLCVNHRTLFPVLMVLITKELLTLVAAAIWLRSGLQPISARWWGKLSTIVIFTTMFYVVLLDIIENLTIIPLYILIVASIVCMLISVLGYFRLFSGEIKGEKTK
jgi:cardiolipin synthase